MTSTLASLERDARQALTIARIIKVNHGGEFGAVSIYQAQIWIARRFYPDTAPVLEDILQNEIRHCAAFQEAMPVRGARPCRLMRLWSTGGFLLGISTAILGRQAIWICTSAVEHAVHRHMKDQLVYLKHRDPELHDMVAAIQRDELMHLGTADAQVHSATILRAALHRFVFLVTDVVIWLSTSGDSSRMRRALAHNRAAN